MIVMTKDSPSNASIIKQKLNEEAKIDLYPEQPKTLTDTMSEAYTQLYAVKEAQEARAKALNEFKNNLKEFIFESFLFESFFKPVLQEQMVATRQYELAAKLTEDFIHENGIDNLLDRFKYKNVYLAEVAYESNKLYNALIEGIDCHIKEGLSEKDATSIEEKSINKYIIDNACKVPGDITNIIIKRVEGSINDFIDEKKKAQFQLSKVYNKAQEKVAKYNQAKIAVDAINQIDDNPDSAMDGEPSYNANMDMQQAQDNINDQSVQQEAVSEAKAAEHQILSGRYGIFEGMMRSFVESIHTIKPLQEAYTDDKNAINFNKVFNDVKTMYTFLETVNTLEMIDINEEYLQKMLKDLAGK